MAERYLFKQVQDDLKRKMVFLAGPRQVGKTTLAKHLLGKNQDGYLNWDIDENREKILTKVLPRTKLWIFDEIHKFRAWRNYLKGLYDQFHETRQILVTGSARLDLYRRGGDSLQGRYHFLRLHPFSFKELDMTSQKDFMDLLKLGGFPEPFFSGSEIQAKRWSQEYRSRLVREEVTSLEQVQDLGHLELLYLRLPKLVGSPLSVNALREDLQVSHRAVSNWLNILERLYGIFRLSPFGAPKIRAVKKEQKHYHMDWTLVLEKGFRFENLVAVHLLKWVHYQQDCFGRELDLRYFRDIDKREVDFVITEDEKPILAIECKFSDKNVSDSLRYFKTKFPQCRAVQVLAQGKGSYITDQKIEITPAIQFLQELV